jgi:hypothetical protein
MRLRRALAVLLVLVFYLQPATVQASTYSSLTYVAKLWPPGYSPPAASACEQAGVIDTARNYGQVQERDYVDSSCSGSPHYVGTAYLGVKVGGFRDGALCGYSSYYWSTQPAFGWQLWITMCDNPSGTQQFATEVLGSFWDGYGYWREFVGPVVWAYY